MHVVGDIADGWEQFANALSPTLCHQRSITNTILRPEQASSACCYLCPHAADVTLCQSRVGGERHPHPGLHSGMRCFFRSSRWPSRAAIEFCMCFFAATLNSQLSCHGMQCACQLYAVLC